VPTTNLDNLSCFLVYLWIYESYIDIMMQRFYFLGLVWFKLRYLMWYFKNKTQLQQLVFCEYIYFFYYLLFLFFGYHFNIRMEQKYPKLFFFFLVVLFFISNERNAIILWIPQDFFFFWEKLQNFQKPKTNKTQKKCLCGLFYVL